MFELMEHEGLYPPELRLEADAIFTVVLRNTPVYEPETLHWLRQFDPLGLSGNQKRLLAYAREHGGTFTSRAYQKLAGVDLYTASRDIKDLIRKRIVGLSKKGGRVYELHSSIQEPGTEKPPEYVALEPILGQQGYLKNEDIRNALGVSAQQANRIVRRLEQMGWLQRKGEKRGTRYFPTHE